MSISFAVSAILPAAAEVLYAAWLDSAEHTAMTGGAAAVSAEVGGSFTAWDGYISGQNISLEPGKRIVQAWRTVDFADEEPDSALAIEFEPAADGTQVTIRHSQLPPHGMTYEQGWIDNYFDPMRRYFQP